MKIINRRPGTFSPWVHKILCFFSFHEIVFKAINQDNEKLCIINTGCKHCGQGGKDATLPDSRNAKGNRGAEKEDLD